MKTSKSKKPTRAELERKLLEAHASSASSHAYACLKIPLAHTDQLTGSGVVLQVTYLGGKPLIDPILIRDGLDQELIEAIQANVRRSHDLALSLPVEG